MAQDLASGLHSFSLRVKNPANQPAMQLGIISVAGALGSEERQFHRMGFWRQQMGNSPSKIGVDWGKPTDNCDFGKFHGVSFVWGGFLSRKIIGDGSWHWVCQIKSIVAPGDSII